MNPSVKMEIEEMSKTGMEIEKRFWGSSWWNRCSRKLYTKELAFFFFFFKE